VPRDSVLVVRHAAGAARFDGMVAAAREGAHECIRRGSAYRALELAESALGERPDDADLLTVAAQAAWMVRLSEDAERHAMRRPRAGARVDALPGTDDGPAGVPDDSRRTGGGPQGSAGTDADTAIRAGLDRVAVVDYRTQRAYLDVLGGDGRPPAAASHLGKAEEQLARWGGGWPRSVVCGPRSRPSRPRRLPP
jgi:hypothetical protein